MAAIFIAFLLWLFATGKYADWAALVTAKGYADSKIDKNGVTGSF